MKVRILLSLILAVLLSGIAAGEFLDVNQPSVVTIWGGPIGEKQVQSFTAGSDANYITAFEWKVWNPGGTADKVKVDLREYVLDDYGMDDGLLLGTKEETFAGASDGDWLRVEFNSPVKSTP